MAKGNQRVTKRTIEVIGEAEEERQPDEIEDAEDVAMEDAARDFAEGDRAIKLYRYPPGELGGRPRFLGELIREDFNETFVAQRYGGGRYFGRWRKKNGVFMRYPFEIEGEPLPIRRESKIEEEIQPFAPTFENVQSSGDLSAVDVLRMMAETRKEAREEMKMFLEMMRPAPAAPQATEQVFSLVEKIVPLIQGGSAGGESNPWLFALSQLKEPLMKVVDTIHTAVNRQPQAVNPQKDPNLPPLDGGPGRPAVHRGAVPLPANPPASVVKSEEKPVIATGEDDMLIGALKSYLPILTHAASVGGDPTVYADMILDQVPSFAYDRLRTWLLKPGCLEELAQHDATIRAQQQWWESLRGFLIEALNEELGNVRTIQPSTDSNPSALSATTSAEDDRASGTAGN